MNGAIVLRHSGVPISGVRAVTAVLTGTGGTQTTSSR